jgi:steroid 5-alpha reductase family enzyme
MRQDQSTRKFNADTGYKPFQPAIGRDFGSVEDVEVRTRAFIAKVVVIASVAAALVAGGYSVVTGNYAVIPTVWAVVGPLLGAVVSHYFGTHGSRRT